MIAVLLSTYNGEEYLKEQIESITKQSDVEWKLYIRDDGSTDKTKDILKSYSSNSNIVVEYGENLGYIQSFLKLLNDHINDAEYFAFCDQDDIWQENKLIKAYEKLSKLPKNKPSLYHSDLKAVNENLIQIGYKSFENRKKSLGSSISRTFVSGCTSVFNKELGELVIKNYQLVKIGHDSWLANVAFSVGAVVYYDDNSYILFRRHSNNTSNYKANFLKKLKVEYQMNWKNKNSKLVNAQLLLENYNEQIPIDIKEVLIKIATYKNTYFNRVQLLFSRKIDTGDWKLNLINKWLILTGIY